MPKNAGSDKPAKSQLPRSPQVAAVVMPTAGSVKACERQDNPKAAIRGEYYFVVKVVPVNVPEPMRPQFVGTIHYTSEASAKAAGGAMSVAVGSTTLASSNGFRFEVQDLNSALDSFADAKCAIESTEGKGWLSNAVDYIVLKATIS
jgi:hypothetical protein